MKRVLSLVLALSMVLGMCTFAFATELSDVDGQYYQASVEALVELGVVNGYPDGTYRANEVVTRAELAKMLVICLGQEEAAKIAAGSTQFTDVPAGHWAEGYINVATQYKVIVGYPDGTFLPEEPVTYAEAVTMVLRALGYKNVVESAGTWPTNYITKANELQLLKDARDLETDAGAKRGNVAIILWNMLRTEMWDIREENQTNGMTYGKTTEPMLNIKFPDYRYSDEFYFETLRVEEGRAYVKLYTEDEYLTNGKPDSTKGTEGELLKGDLLRLVPGMRVAALYNKEDEEFLTLTPMDTLVEGTVTKTGTSKFEIDEVEYRDDRDDDSVTLAVNDYVVALVEGKKVKALVVLPTEATEVEKLRTVENRIDEDALVLIDGEWATRDDIELGDVYTEIKGNVDGLSHLTGTFYAVARERDNGTFESFTVTTNKKVADRYSIEVDGTEYTALSDAFVAYDGEDNDNQVVHDEDGEGLREKEKTNKYLDRDVELVFNYLGQVVKMYFGEVSELDAEGDFYVITSDGSWYTSGSKGKTYYILLTGADGEEEEYTFATTALGQHYDTTVSADVDEENVFEGNGYFTAEDFKAMFVYVEFNNDGEISKIEPVKAGQTADEEYTMAAANQPLDENNYLDSSLKGKVTSTTVVMTATPIMDDDEEEVAGVEVKVTTGTDAVEGVLAANVLYATKADSKAAKYVFVTAEAESQDLLFGVVTDYTERRGTKYVWIDGDDYEIGTAEGNKFDATQAPIGSLVVYTNTDDKVVCKAVFKADAVDHDAGDAKYYYVEKVNGEMVTVRGQEEYDLEKEAKEDESKKTVFGFVEATVGEDNMLEFDEKSAEVLGKGLESAMAEFKKGDILLKDSTNNAVIIVRIDTLGLDKNDVIVNGEVMDYGDETVLAEETTAAVDSTDNDNKNNYEFVWEGDTLKVTGSNVVKNTSSLSSTLNGYGFTNQNAYHVFFKLTAPEGVKKDDTATISLKGSDGTWANFTADAFDGDDYIELGFEYTAENQKVIREIRVKWNADTPEYTVYLDLSNVEFGS